MITLRKQGKYELIETKHSTRVLILDDVLCYAWIYAKGIGDILVYFENKPVKHKTIVVGEYQVLDIENEKFLTNEPHLQLMVGENRWQSYLLPHGLPDTKDKKNRIITTHEFINVEDSRIHNYDILLDKSQIKPPIVTLQ